MDIGQFVILLVVMAAFIGLLVLAALYIGYTSRRSQRGSQPWQGQLTPRVVPPAPLPLMPPRPPTRFEPGTPAERPGRIRWGDEQSPGPAHVSTERLNSALFPRCPICRQPLLPEQSRIGQVTACRHCNTPYHTACIEYTNNVCPTCQRA